jgi:hypothetical protein
MYFPAKLRTSVARLTKIHTLRAAERARPQPRAREIFHRGTIASAMMTPAPCGAIKATRREEDAERAGWGSCLMQRALGEELPES